MRLFVSIELPQEIKRNLEKVQSQLRSLIKAKWTAPEQFHLTLKFLGETPDAQLPQITDALSTVRFEIPIALQTRGIVCFPPHGPIRIIAATMSDETGACALLQSQIDEACHRAGFPRDARRWTPHVTVGRVKERSPAAARDVQLPQMQFEIDEFYLMESRLDRIGPKYLRLSTFTIQDPGTAETRY
jgi:2'-5' RNA ligase